jgi:hypothetical protein
MSPLGESDTRIPLPERIDRPLRLGPFPSARDAIKGMGYALAGVVAVPFVGLWGWLPMIAIGLAVGLVQIDGVPLDRGIYLRFRRRWRREELLRRQRTPGLASGERRTLDFPDGRRVGIVQADGSPLAFLPPTELRQRLAIYRELLVDCGSGGVLVVSTLPISSSALLPPERAASASPLLDDAARASYHELLQRLCERRRHRRVYLALWSSGSGGEALSQLEGRLAAVGERWAALGGEPRRLSGTELLRAARRFGWEVARISRVSP